MSKKLKFTLIDDPNPSNKLKGTAHDDNGGLMIYVDGYGQEGQPVAGLVMQDGRLRLMAFNNVDSDEPVTIEMEGAKRR